MNVLSINSAKGAGPATAGGAKDTKEVKDAGKEVKEAMGMGVMMASSNKDSRRIKELIEKTSELEERVGRNTNDLQKLKDVKERQKHLANLIDKKADIEALKKLQSELDTSNQTMAENKHEIGGIKKLLDAMPSFDRLEKMIIEQGKRVGENESRIG